MASCSPVYRGKLKAVIFDWAGTTVDFGCQAPVAVLREIFEAAGVVVTVAVVKRAVILASDRDDIDRLVRASGHELTIVAV